MKVKDVQIDGFGVWTDLSVDGLPDTMTVFYGPNEAGKTTLMQFLRTMFYGFTADRRQRYLPPVYGGKPGGAIRVTGPGGGYEISRRAQLDQNSVAGQLAVTGSDGLAQGQHRLAMLLGQVDETIFTNVFAIGLRELQELSTLDDTAAADELYKLSSGLDRVSLVDVIRQLRSTRQQLVGPTPEHGQIQQLLVRREKLRDEIEQVTARGRRWAELAALRQTQNTELEELKQRIGQWAIESRTVEIALQVRPNWVQRAQLQQSIKSLNARTDLSDEASGKLEAINQEIANRTQRVAELKGQRRALREKSRQLPLRPALLELVGRIEAASEQSPWISQIQKNMQRIESQIQQTREQLAEDAKRLGISDEDFEALLNDRRMTKMPDLSRQAIAQLAGPARDVRMYLTRMKQAKQQSEIDKKEAQRLAKEIAGSLSTREHDTLTAATQSTGDLIALLRKRLQIQENLDKYAKRRETLEMEAIDLATDEALPVERTFMMGLVFVGGAFSAIWGAFKMLGWMVEADSQYGMLLFVLGMFMLFAYFIFNSTLDRGTIGELDDVEDQLDALKKELRKIELERDEYDRKLPPHTGSLDTRLRDAEAEMSALELLFPLQHNHQAAMERHFAARKRAQQSAESLKQARGNWTKTLQQLGLSDSLSPKSIRIMAEGYESLLQTRRRLQALEEELDQRRLELGNITQRIDGLVRQAQATRKAGDVTAGQEQSSTGDRKPAGDSRARDQRDKSVARDPDVRTQRENRPNNVQSSNEVTAVKAEVENGNSALEQLNRLNAMIAEQEQYIQQRRTFRAEDLQLAKQQTALERSVDRLRRAHSALLAEIGCESEEQLHALLDVKKEYEKLVASLSEMTARIQSVIGGAIPYDAVARHLDNPGAEDLEKRWEALQQRAAQAEQRVHQLHQRQGEIGQEMKSLAADCRLAEAKLELVCIENQIKACASHWQTLAATTSMLEKVCEVYETERQPETLREASAFLSQLTEGKYVRVWTPLGKNQLRVDNAQGQALPLEVLSRGTRETVFIALRLSLAAAYARRGVMLPLVLDDVFVNFDRARTVSAAKVLRDFASLGHQVVMFTCHEHIMKIFYDIGVQIRLLPAQGMRGEAKIHVPEIVIESVPMPPIEVVQTIVAEPEEEIVEEDESAEESIDELATEFVAEPDPVMSVDEPSIEDSVETADEPSVVQFRLSEIEERSEHTDDPPNIDWLWYQRDLESKVAALDELPEWIESSNHPDIESPFDAPWWRENSMSSTPSYK